MKLPHSLSTRREFIVTAAGALATASVSNVFAQGAGKIRVAVIGTGGRGCDLVRKLSTIESAEIVAVSDDYEPHLRNGARYAGKQAKTFSDYRKMLEQIKPAVVVVAVPLWLHYQVCCDALDSGADVFCEKTMTHSIEEGRKLAAKVRGSKQVFQVGLQRRANPIYNQARAMIETGMLGRITAARCQWHRNNNWRRPVPVERTHAKWNELEKRLNWRLYRKFSQGLMAELGSHQMDVINWMFDAAPSRVMATGGVDYWRDGREVADNVFCIYEYTLKPTHGEESRDPYTVRVTYSSLCNNAYEGASELIMGTRGTLFLTDKKGLLFLEKGADDVGWVKKDASGTNASIVTSGKTLGLTNDPWAFRGKPVEIDNEGGDDTREELVSFLHHVRDRDLQTICDVNIGLRNAATILIANEAIDARKTVEFPRDLRS
ncbi:MAG: Gfo/Idh/MocA family oxidoreductase [Verrucomicrobia bacterium]|nr:Gfo/Idh/MocA family oxidoreductase [Verrucomicrobiota bacterium]